jgi:ABC-type uncharacterized transport system substrate-binding protein
MLKPILLATAALAALPAAALAHPHIFANARVEIVAGDGAVKELRNIWRFDEVFSSSVVMDFDKNGNSTLDPDELEEVGKTVRKSLADYSYYTNLFADNRPVKVNQPDMIHVDYKDGQLLMFFAVSPAEPMALKGKLSIGVYDPTLYTAIDFATDGDMVTEGEDFKACTRAVVRPDPDEVIKQNQASLTDAFFSDPTGTNMSKLFATRLEVTC